MLSLLRNGTFYPLTVSPTKLLVQFSDNDPIDLNGQLAQVITKDERGTIYEITCGASELKYLIDRLRKTFPKHAIHHVYHYAGDPTPLWITNLIMLTFANGPEPVCSNFQLAIQEEIPIGEAVTHVCQVVGRNPIKVLAEIWRLHGPQGDGRVLEADLNLIWQVV